MNRAVIPLFGLALTGATALAAALLYARLPEAMPVHFDLNGQPDGFAHKPFGPFMFPTMIGVFTLLLSVLPLISPRRFEMDAFASSYRLIACALLGLIAWIDAVTTAAGLGASLDPGRAGLVGAGLMFMAVGNVLGKLTPNFFVGVRTPWTLANPEVWRRTHRVGSWIFVLAGAGVALTAAFGEPVAPAVLLLIAAVLGLGVYSYLVYRKLERRGDEP